MEAVRFFGFALPPAYPLVTGKTYAFEGRVSKSKQSGFSFGIILEEERHGANHKRHKEDTTFFDT